MDTKPAAPKNLRLSLNFQDNIYAAVRLSQVFDTFSGLGIALEPKPGAEAKHVGSAIWDVGDVVQKAVVRSLEGRYPAIAKDDIYELTDKIISDLTTRYEAANENPSKQVMADEFIEAFETAIAVSTDQKGPHHV